MHQIYLLSYIEDNKEKIYQTMDFFGRPIYAVFKNLKEANIFLNMILESFPNKNISILKFNKDFKVMKAKIVPTVKREDRWPTKDKKKFKKVQAEQDTIEKRQTPKEHKRLVKEAKKLPANQDLGHVNKKGQEFISKKVPKRDRPYVEKALKEEHDLMLDKKIKSKKKPVNKKNYVKNKVKK